MGDPLKHVGPPPSEQARAGRMNAEGVAVFYGSLDVKTCMAEARPTIGSEIAVITLKTTRSLRVLDFSRLSIARDKRGLSYFQSDYDEQSERREFLRMLHAQISQPIVPGHESDYLITQTMAEYLSHVHPRPFDGILFGSVQKAGGINLVVFPKNMFLETTTSDLYGVALSVAEPAIYTTKSVSYRHEEQKFFVNETGDPTIYNLDSTGDDDWFE